MQKIENTWNPQIKRIRGGSWMALAAHDARICIGVIAESEAAAREKFTRSMDEWLQNLNTSSHA